MAAIRKNHSSSARLHCIRFLYICETRSIYFFSPTHFHAYWHQSQLSSQNIPASKSIRSKTRGFCKKVYQNIFQLDAQLSLASEHWALYRMNTMDRAILRLGCCEMLFSRLSRSIIIHEALLLAELFGGEKSKAYIHGVLNATAKHAEEEGEGGNSEGGAR